MKTVFAVFGDPIEHSMSPKMHNAAFTYMGMDCEYHAFRVGRDSLHDALIGAKAMGFGGVNLTVPLKEEALNIVDADPLAARIGAVNTVDPGDGMRGYNTDGIGAKRALADAGVDVANARVLIVGAGGAARAISFQFANDSANITIANRTEKRACDLARDVSSVGTAHGTGLANLKDLIAQADILVNTTTLGMHPNTDQTIATSDDMHPDLTVFDIIYNPLETRLLKEAKIAGATAVNGVMMLVYQGAEAFRIWNGVEPPVDVMRDAVLEALGAQKP
ncbi:MAG TPA: shikimate dehydrogenase [Methanosarcinaceae archaeon]|nr:shikimate dehydrogenase [Methanosarcinaceae archaeon]